MIIGILVVVYIIMIPFVVYLYRNTFSRRYYLVINDTERKYRIKRNFYRLKINNSEYSFYNSGLEWHVTALNYDESVKINQNFRFEGTYARITESGDYTRVSSSIFSFFIILPMFLVIIFKGITFLPRTEEGKVDYAALIYDDNETTNGDVVHAAEIENTKYDCVSVKSDDVIVTAYNSECSTIQVSSDIVWIDNKNNSVEAEDLIGKRICASYTGEQGETCFIVGHYNEDYEWDGKTNICAYLDGKLFYTTEDIYVKGKLVSYKRISRYNNRWIYTEKTVDENDNTFGDTWCYDYRDIKEKVHTTELPVENDLYFVDEVRSMIASYLVRHYRGAYDPSQNWFDLSGNAYSIKYENGKIIEIFKGTFVGNSNYGTGMCISPLSNGKFEVRTGDFHDDFGNEVNNLQYNYYSLDDMHELIKGELFENEVNENGWFIEQSD